MGINYSLDKTFEASNIETLCAAIDICQRCPSFNLRVSDFYYQPSHFGVGIFFCYAQNNYCKLFYKFRRLQKEEHRKQAEWDFWLD